MSPSVAEAYRACREIARREAKNFYYAFVALPEPKRNAICAVYAFMRHADDLSDDESTSIPARRQALADWLAAWHDAEQGAPTQDPVFIALADAARRFHIPSALLDQLVEGTAMDLDRAAAVDTYATFNELYRYCYLVASVVGLVCIRIFEYSDPRAEKLAEETGVAFQLTNILRDVREDAQRGRIYLPVEDLARFGLTVQNVRTSAVLSPNLRELLAFEARRAEKYYEAAQSLLPLIAPDSRPALEVLVSIYHRLLEEIDRRDYDVLSSRISVSTPRKFAILGRGLLQVGAYRLTGSR